MKIKLKILLSLLLVFVLIGCGSTKTTNEIKETKSDVSNTNPDKTKDIKNIEFILDWVPNTNHTGLYVAKKLGFDKEFGINLDVKRPPEGSTTELISTGHANFGISFQDSLANKFAKGINVKAVAAIIDNNTSGILSIKSADINNPKDMADHSYGTWDDPIEKSIIDTIMKNNGSSLDKVKLVPNTADNSIIGLANNMFESAWVYYAWDVILAKHSNVDTNFFFIKDYADELNFYSPVIIVNSDYIKTNPETVKATMKAIQKGYQYAMQHPEEAAKILIENAPELADKEDFVLESQKWISKNYATSPEKWGYIDKVRWDSFYKYLYDNKLIDKDISQESLFTNEFLGE